VSSATRNSENPNYKHNLLMMKMSWERICAVIPTYNEADNVEPLIQGLESLGCVDWILIVDDSSNDGTLEKLAQLRSEYENLTVHVRPGKLGFGTALKEGFTLALEKFNLTRLIQMDADLSHDPSFIPDMLSKQADLIIGSRYIEGGKIIGWNKRRKITSKTANFLVNTLLGLKIHDVTSGFRVYSRRAVETIATQATAVGYEFEIEAALLARKHQMSIEEVPITFVDRRKGETKLKTREIFRFLGFVLRNIQI